MADLNGITIRGAEMDDLDAIVEIMRDAEVARLLLQTPFTSREYRRSWLVDALSSPDQRVLVAERNGQVVGNLGVRKNPNPRTSHIATIGMSVAREHQGQGVGGALMLACIDLCDNWWPILRIELDVYVDNEPAIALYEKFGFEREGVARKAAIRDGQLVDCLYMARLRKSALS